jgi:Bacterial SH3 domain
VGEFNPWFTTFFKFNLLEIMNILIKTVFLLILSVSANAGMTSPILAQSDVCRIRAHVTDQDSMGLNVRMRPSFRGQIIGQLPGNSEVNVLKTQGHWMLVSPITPETQNLEFRGQGWVSKSFLGLGTRGYGHKTVAIYRKASMTSRIAGNIPSNSAIQLLGCKGSWVFVEKNGVRGWLPAKDQCAAALTSCS